MRCNCGKEVGHGRLQRGTGTLFWYGCADCEIYVDSFFMSVAILKFLYWKPDPDDPDGTEYRPSWPEEAAKEG